MMGSNHSPSRSPIIFNILGGSFTLFSLQLPWLVMDTPYGVSLQPGSLYPVAFYWLLAGALLSFLSRYAGFFTLLGIFAFLGEPFLSFRTASGGLGFFIALTGSLFTFAGARWSIPESLTRGRLLLGGVLYTVGFLILLTVTVNMFVYRTIFSALEQQLIVQVPITLAGVFLTIQGLRIYLSPGRKVRIESLVHQE